MQGFLYLYYCSGVGSGSGSGAGGSVSVTGSVTVSVTVSVFVDTSVVTLDRSSAASDVYKRQLFL